MAHPLRCLTQPRQSIETLAVECSICIEKLVLDAIFYTPCGHTYHEHCIRFWLKRNTTCPQCRQALQEQQIRCIRCRPSQDNSDCMNLTLLQTQNKALKLNLQLNDMKIESQKSEEERLTLSLNVEKNKIANVTERLTAFKSLREIVNKSRQHKNIPDTNRTVALVQRIRHQKREMELSIALEHDNQQTMSDILRLKHITTRCLNGDLQGYSEKKQLMKKEIKELEGKLATFQPITSTPIEAPVKPKGVKAANKLQVDEKKFSPNAPIATRTRSRLRTIK